MSWSFCIFIFLVFFVFRLLRICCVKFIIELLLDLLFDLEFELLGLLEIVGISWSCFMVKSFVDIGLYLEDFDNCCLVDDRFSLFLSVFLIFWGFWLLIGVVDFGVVFVNELINVGGVWIVGILLVSDFLKVFF